MPRTRPLSLLTLAALAALLACGDRTPTGITSPPGGSPARDADLDTLFGSSAAAAVAAQRAQRAALTAAADSALAVEFASTAASAGLTAARIAASPTATSPMTVASMTANAAAPDPALPPPFAFRDTKTERHLDGPDPWESTTTTTLDATVSGGTLTVVGTERSVVRRLPVEGHPGSSTVTEVRNELDVALCPDAAGLSAGRWTSAERSWSVRRSADLAGSGNHDAVTEQTAEGTTAARVNDAAEIEAYDLDVLFSARKARLPGNRPIDKRATYRIVRRGIAPGDLRRGMSDAFLPERTGDHDMLRTLGYGPEQFHIFMTMRVQTAYRRARGAWRGGACVEVVPARGATGGPLAPGATVTLGPEARHKMDGSVVTVGTHAAAASSGTVAAPASGVAHPATFRFTMPATGGARVNFTATSRRGIGRGSVAFTEAGAANGRIDYQATSTYSVSGTDEWDQTVGGSLTGQETVETTLRLEPDRREPDGTRWYKVLAENRIALGGAGELTGAIDGWKVTYKLGLDGEGASHNPVAAGDVPMKEHRIIAPYQRRPQYSAGEMRLYTQGGRPMYELRVNINQIAPGFTWSRRTEMECPEGGRGVQTEAYDNGTRATTVAIDDPKRCIRHHATSHTDDAPYTFGAIATNWFENDPSTGSNAMVTGTYEPGATQLVGNATYTTADCERVRYLDPTQLGQFALSYSGFPIGLSFVNQGRCTFTYTIRWTIPLPAGE